MTKEEAIEMLVNATYSDEWQGNEKLTTAHLMAIEALECEPSKDGTLEVKVKDATKIGRVLISDDKHRGGLYYPDEDEPQPERPKIIVHVDRPKGKWIDMPYTPSHTKYMCSECGKVMYTNSEYIKEQNFCFSCGAYMEGEDK